jgi:uncharacterized protein (DUF1501 family)
LLPVTPKSLDVLYGFHPKLAEIQAMFSQGQLALLANAGTLVQPTFNPPVPPLPTRSGTARLWRRR